MPVTWTRCECHDWIWLFQRAISNDDDDDDKDDNFAHLIVAEKYLYVISNLKATS